MALNAKPFFFLYILESRGFGQGLHPPLLAFHPRSKTRPAVRATGSSTRSQIARANHLFSDHCLLPDY